MTDSEQSPPWRPDSAEGLADIYRHIHRSPELSYQETATAALVADLLRTAGYDVRTGVGGTGVVGVLASGDGPTVLVRADMDALPVQEQTGLDYASTVRGTDPDGKDVPVMHACGHDMHVTCLLGAATQLAAARAQWSGTLVVVFQPAEELGSGARSMVQDGLFEHIPQPVVVLGQHVVPMPSGMIGLRSGAAFAASDSLRVVLHGHGGHGSQPESTIDPVVMAAAVVLRLQGIVSREIRGSDTAVVTVGSLQAGTKNNIIGDRAELGLSVRTFDPAVRTRVLGAIDRIVNGEAQVSGATTPPEIVALDSFPTLVNDPDASERTRAALIARFGADAVQDPGPVTASEDVGELATAAGAPCVYWVIGGADPALFAQARSAAELGAVVATLPSNHSPFFAPVIQPTLDTGVAALVAAAREWLG